MPYDFCATRQGEAERACAKCGKPYRPNSRTQRYCKECGRQKTRTKDMPARKKRGLEEAERFMYNNLKRLNDVLFRQLGRIEDAETPEELEEETKRAKSVQGIAETIISNGRLVLEASRASMTTAESVQVPNMLLGRGDG